MTNSLYNPFSPLRHLNLWSIAAFSSSGGGDIKGAAGTMIPFTHDELYEGALGVVAGDYTVESFLETAFAEEGGWIPEACPLFSSHVELEVGPASDYVPGLTHVMNDTLGPGEGQIFDYMMFNYEDVMDTGVFGKEAADTAPDATIAAAQDDGGSTAMGAALVGKETDAPTTDGRGEAKPHPLAEKVQQTMDETTVQGASPSEASDDRGSRTDEGRPGHGDDQDDQTAEVPASVDP